MKKAFIRYMLIIACLSTVCLIAGCKSGQTPNETDPATLPDTTDAVSDGSETSDETESEPEPETRPEIILPMDPAEIVALIDSIPSGSIENEAKIDLAYAAWAALSEADREKVTNYDTLRIRLQELADAHIVKEYRDDRIPHGELLIGAYFAHNGGGWGTPGREAAFYRTEAYVQDIVNAHINMTWHAPKDVLDLYEKYGIGAVGTAPFKGWASSRAEEGNGSMPNVTIVQSAASMADYWNHPAMWGWDLSDEMNSNSFWHLGEVADIYNQSYYSVPLFANLSPSYGDSKFTGSYAYRKYAQNYANRVDSEIISVDYYMYQNEMGQGRFLRNLGILAEICAKDNLDLWAIVSCNAAPGQKYKDKMTLEMMKHQAYTSLAFGAKNVTWACYACTWGPDAGWTTPVLDGDGNKTEVYYMMQECNADLVTLSPIYMRYTAKGQSMLNSDPEGSRRTFFANMYPLEDLAYKTIDSLSIGDEGDVLVGFFEKNVGEGEAFFFANNSDIHYMSPITSTVTFRTVSPASVVTAYVKGIPTILDPVDGVYTVEVKDADAVFVTVSEPDSINAGSVVYPIGQLTVAGKDIGDFTVVIPANATEREQQAAEALVALIAKATGKTLPIVTDAENPAVYISLGNTALSAPADTARASVQGDGYALLTKDGNLYITGVDADGAGTLMGVYGFCEDYLGYRFYTQKDVVIPNADTISIPDSLNEVINPAFLHRDATFDAALNQPYPLYQKYNGHMLYGDMGFANEWWVGNSLYYTVGVGSSDTVCLSSEDIYTQTLQNARHLLECDIHADYVALDIGQDGKWAACSCEACTSITAAEGTPMALLLNFANRLANDLKADHPNVKVTTMAVGDMIGVPATVRPSDDVVIRLVMPEDACRFHALNDETCTVNNGFRAAVESWTAVSKNVMILDNATKRGEFVLTPGANLLTMYDTVQYLLEKGVMGYQHIGYDQHCSEMDALRSYLLSRLLWDADMTREEYLTAMDEFLQAYYGAGWQYIRQYIDKMGSTEDTDHEAYPSYLQMLGRTTEKKSTFVLDCITLWEQALEAADTERHARNVEKSSIQLHQINTKLGNRSKELRKLIEKYGLSSEIG